MPAVLPVIAEAPPPKPARLVFAIKSVGVPMLAKFNANVPPLRFNPPVKVFTSVPLRVNVPTPVLVSPTLPLILVEVFSPDDCGGPVVDINQARAALIDAAAHAADCRGSFLEIQTTRICRASRRNRVSARGIDAGREKQIIGE